MKKEYSTDGLLRYLKAQERLSRKSERAMVTQRWRGKCKRAGDKFATWNLLVRLMLKATESMTGGL